MNGLYEKFKCPTVVQTHNRISNLKITMNSAKIFRRFLTQFQEKFDHGYKMKAWQIHSYGEPLQLTESRIPLISNPDDVLVRVDAASVNPIDKIMLGGYGRALLNVARRFELEFPLTVGRDFSGVIIDKGHSVGPQYKVGDRVYGFVPLHRPGTHAEAVLTHKRDIAHLPEKLTPAQAASIPYVAMTAWSALFVTGELGLTTAKNRRVLILGASGGVGTVATQMLKTHGAIVIGTCSLDAVKLVESLGADAVYDYRGADYVRNIAAEGIYDVILDCAKFGYENLPPSWKFKKFVTLNSPLMLNTDKYGVLPGLAASARDLLLPRITAGKNVRWGFFLPSGDGFKCIDGLVKDGKITPIVHKVVKFEELPTAFEILTAGHLRGKVVVDYN